jgi:hypothetical protein
MIRNQQSQFERMVDSAWGQATGAYIARREEVLTSAFAHHQALPVLITAREVDPAEDVFEGCSTVFVLGESRVYISLQTVLVRSCTDRHAL